jgi:hypothetical protein
MHTLFVHLWCRSISPSKSYCGIVDSCVAFTVFRACRGLLFSYPSLRSCRTSAQQSYEALVASVLRFHPCIRSRHPRVASVIHASIAV